MNLTSPAMRAELMSAVERNKALLTIGDVVGTTDDKYRITQIDLSEDYWVGINTETDEEEYFGFDLGHTWYVKEAQNIEQMVFRTDNPDERWITYQEKQARSAW